MDRNELGGQALMHKSKATSKYADKTSLALHTLIAGLLRTYKPVAWVEFNNRDVSQ